MPSWRVEDVRSLADTLRDLARALEDAAAEASARAVDDGDGELALSVVRGTALAGNVAEALDAALERVREHAGDAFADVRATRRATKSVMRTRGGDGDDGSVDAEGDGDLKDDLSGLDVLRGDQAPVVRVLEEHPDLGVGVVRVAEALGPVGRQPPQQLLQSQLVRRSRRATLKEGSPRGIVSPSSIRAYPRRRRMQREAHFRRGTPPR